MIAEVRNLMSWEERHGRLLARLGIVLGVTVVIDFVGALLVYLAERHAHNTQIHDFGDALFFSTVQLLTVSSQIQNPFTAAGRIVDVFLELWAVVVVASIAGSFGSFFIGGDKSP